MDELCIFTKCVQIFACAVQNDVPKIENKHLAFKASVAKMKTHVFIDNDSKAKLNNKFFVRKH